MIITHENIVIAMLGMILYAIIVPPPRKKDVKIDIYDAIRDLKAAAEHYTDVSAVVAMINQLSELDEQDLAGLEEYPKTVRTAAMLHYVNTLGASLQTKQTQLEEALTNSYVGSPTVQLLMEDVKQLQAELNRAINLSDSMTTLK